MKYYVALLLVLFSSGCSTCKGVLGFRYSSYTHKIDYTITGYPAEQIGLQPGDEILYPELLQGEAGEIKHIRVIRDQKVLEFDAPLKCYNEWDDLTNWKEHKSEKLKK